jgi:hypothetical protein
MGWLALTIFMSILYYTYLLLKMPGPHGVIFIRGDIKRAYNYDTENYETANKLMASVEL